MRTLGALLAGGRSSRFGGDKALAPINGRPLIAHAAEALALHADDVVCCGRAWPGMAMLADCPAGGHGPLAGLNAALGYALENGFETVLCAPLDVHPLARALPRLAGVPCAVLRSQWAIGRWPASLGPALDRHLANGQRSIRSWLAASGAQQIDDADLDLRNINHADDLPASMPGFNPTANSRGQMDPHRH